MALTFDWFLPTSGDGRTIYGRGHSLPLAQAQATVMRPPDPVPGIYFGGSSAAAGPVAARYVDTYLTWGEPPAQVAEKLAWMRGSAATWSIYPHRAGGRAGWRLAPAAATGRQPRAGSDERGLRGRLRQHRSSCPGRTWRGSLTRHERCWPSWRAGHAVPAAALGRRCRNRTWSVPSGLEEAGRCPLNGSCTFDAARSSRPAAAHRAGRSG